MAGWEEAEEVGRAALEGWYRTLDVEKGVVLQVRENTTEPGNAPAEIGGPAIALPFASLLRALLIFSSAKLFTRHSRFWSGDTTVEEASGWLGTDPEQVRRPTADAKNMKTAQI